EFADDDDDLAALDVGGFLVVVLEQDGAVAEGVELAGIGDGGFAGGIAVGVIEFCGPADAGAALDNSVNLALPATSEHFLDLVFASDVAARGKIESFALSAHPF